MNSNSMKKSYTDINFIISNLDEASYKKIPQKLVKYFSENADKSYQTTLTTTKPLSEQQLLPKTEALICLLTLEYLANREEKSNLLEMFEENENKYQVELRKKYNLNNIFQNKKQSENNIKEETENDSMAIVKCKESILKRIINKVNGFFRKNGFFE